MGEEDPSVWLVLAFQLPADEAYARVKIWRRLQGVGAVSFRNAFYMLPADDQTQEGCECVLRKIRACGGEGAIFFAELAASTRDLTLRSLFDAARENDYRALADELRLAVSAPLGIAPDGAARRLLAARVRRKLQDIESVNFFDANGHETVHALLGTLEQAQGSTQGESPMPETERTHEYIGRTWVTRIGVRVDRMASARLIRRHIDPRARFKFVDARGHRPQAGELRFDMVQSEYTHDAGRCTFEVLHALAGGDDSLRATGEIVHDLDIKVGRFDCPEAAGIGQPIDGIVAGSENDEERLERSARLFDDLHHSLGGGRR